MEKESAVIRTKYPEYEVLTTSEERHKNYRIKEIETIISMKKRGRTINDIS
ncbi:hypothetical protein [Robertmurraya sp. FSL R5-0851]|uniref:hypothetical protein n=1 Tax=Robertmurraya sp. FSL R5-0851 TaxID=2921584 RepID=UPI0030FCC1D8